MRFYNKKKRKIALLLLFIFSFLIILSILFFRQKVGIIYFRNDKCLLVKDTDTLMEDVKGEFGGLVDITTVNASLDPDDPEDTEEIKQLRKRYSVIGLPDIIINGKKLTKEFTRSNLFSEICNNFIIKPLVCI